MGVIAEGTDMNPTFLLLRCDKWFAIRIGWIFLGGEFGGKSSCVTDRLDANTLKGTVALVVKCLDTQFFRFGHVVGSMKR